MMAISECPSCGADVAAGTRWCSICHTNVITPNAGALASPGKRLGAYVLDLVIPFVALLLTGVVGGSDDGGGGMAAVGILLLLAYIAWALWLFAHGTTPGKKALRMRVVRENGDPAGLGTMLLREWVGKFISWIVFLLGFLWILFDKENQGWHDKLASTYVTVEPQRAEATGSAGVAGA